AEVLSRRRGAVGIGVEEAGLAGLVGPVAKLVAARHVVEALTAIEVVADTRTRVAWVLRALGTQGAAPGIVANAAGQGSARRGHRGDVALPVVTQELRSTGARSLNGNSPGQTSRGELEGRVGAGGGLGA